MREIVGDARLGTVVAPEDAAGLAAALDHWLDGAAAPPRCRSPARDSAARYLACSTRLA